MHCLRPVLLWYENEKKLNFNNRRQKHANVMKLSVNNFNNVLRT